MEKSLTKILETKRKESEKFWANEPAPDKKIIRAALSFSKNKTKVANEIVGSKSNAKRIQKLLTKTQ